MSRFRKILTLQIIKTITVIILSAALMLFFSQTKIIDNAWGRQVSSLFGNFFSTLSTTAPAMLIRGWFGIDASGLKISSREELVTYQLTILSRSLKNYFSSLLKNTNRLLENRLFRELKEVKLYSQTVDRFNMLLMQYIRNNPDITEMSLFDKDGSKITSIKYKTTVSYSLHPDLLAKLSAKDTLLIRNPENGYLVLVSAIREQNRVIGFISQSINPVFFSKIIDFLHINKNLFYIKNSENSVVVDNFDIYKKVNNADIGYSFLFYRNLTSPEEQEFKIKIDNIDYGIGMIIEKNNLAGDIAVLLILIGIVYLAFVIINVLIRNIRLIYEPEPVLEPVRPAAEIQAAQESGAKTENIFKIIDEELKSIQQNTRDLKKSFTDNLIRPGE
ncbi:MAG: hypothetical protein A2096_01480 [Spirochaetes bacterium GWF1_41_5]|nr:MAG: hypothetical protein A2096_01480 [Spirochaetes bacterium GWF1_41_5]HBE02046.1 hypothetical protein [Spirochaetia bacterium]